MNFRSNKSFLAEQLSRREFLAGAAAASMLATMRDIANASDVETVEISNALIKAAQREGTVTVRYSTPLTDMDVYAKAFREKFGIAVQTDRKVGVIGTQQFATEERAGQHIMDVNLSVDPQGLVELAAEGLYLRYTHPRVERTLLPGSYLRGIAYSPELVEVVIQYNSEGLSHADAKAMLGKWSGLLDPRLKGKIGMTEPAGGGVPFSTYLMLSRRKGYGLDFLKKLATQNPRLYPGSAPGREEVAAGSIAVFLPNWESIAMSNFMRGDKTAWTYPEVAPSFSTSFMAISAKAPHPNAARLFATYFMTLDGARVVESLQSRSTLQNFPDARTAIAELKKTSWWRPYPDRIRWTPPFDEWIASYKTLMPEMRAALGWQG